MDESDELTKRRRQQEYTRYLPQKIDRSHRIIKNLHSASMITDPPALLRKKPRLKGARAKGIRYEKQVGKTLQRWEGSGELFGEVLLGQWFTFLDDNGRGHCQPDILIITSGLIFILECKLTYTEWAWPQLRELYKPVVEKTFSRPAIVVQVCRNLHYTPAGLINSIQELIDEPRDGNNTWHFIY